MTNGNPILEVAIIANISKHLLYARHCGKWLSHFIFKVVLWIEHYFPLADEEPTLRGIFCKYILHISHRL